MLSFQTGDGYTFFLGHVFSFVGITAYLYYLGFQFARKKVDKCLHAGISSLLTAALLTLFHFIGWPWWLSPVIVMVVGVGKEIADRLNKKKRLFDWMDIIADAMGTGSVALLYLFSVLLS